MTAFNADHNNTELLDQELTIEQLEGVAGGDYFALLGAERAAILRAAGYPEELIKNKVDKLQKIDQEWLNKQPICVQKHYQSQR
jgi:hypothetical protein